MYPCPLLCCSCPECVPLALARARRATDDMATWIIKEAQWIILGGMRLQRDMRDPYSGRIYTPFNITFIQISEIESSTDV